MSTSAKNYYHLTDLDAASRIKPFHALEHERPVNRLHEICEFRERVENRYFIIGWVEGPVAMYTMLTNWSRRDVLAVCLGG